MSKTKKKPVVIKNLEEAESAVRRCQEIDLNLEYWKQCEERAIQKVKEKFDAKRAEGDASGLKQERKDLEAAVELWAKTDRKKWGQQSLKLRYGVLAFHAGQPAVKLIKKISKKFDVALDRLKRLDWGYPFIRTVDEINREAILEKHKQWKQRGDVDVFNDQLEQVGLKVDQEESFTVKTDAEQQMKERMKKRKA